LGASCNAGGSSGETLGRGVALVLPVLGPFAAYDIARPNLRPWIFVDSAVQLAGAALAGYGLFTAEDRERAAQRKSGIRVAPLLTPRAAGVSFTVVE
jgi:hypothetical protein